jgi:hypothetical protein
MFNESDKTVVVTVRFNEPVTGTQIAALTQAAIARQQDVSKRFIVMHSDADDIFTFGQASGYPYNHVLVSQSRALPVFRPLGTYLEVKITDHNWNCGGFSIGYNQQDVTDAVEAFAMKFVMAYRKALVIGFPEYVETEDG